MAMAMGTPIMVVVIVNIYMAMLEVLFKDKLTTTLMNIEWSHFYQRFIDDIFLVSEVLKPKPQNFLPCLMRWSHPKTARNMGTLAKIWNSWTLPYSTRFQKEGKLDIKTFQKPQNAYMYIPIPSEHPKDMFKSFVTGQVIRCGFIHMPKIFISRLLDRCYEPTTLKKWFSEVFV
jgi:hypothetical protein